MKSIFFLQNTLIMVSADISTDRLPLAIFHYKFYRSYFPLRIYKYKESGNRSYEQPT